MAGDVYVTFGADAGGLEAAVATSKAAISAFQKEITSLAREMQKTGASADSELGQKLQKVGAELAEAKEKAAQFREQMKGVGESGKVAGEAIDKTRETLLHFAEIAGVEISANAFREWIASSAELGEKMVRTGAMLGTTAEQASQLSAMAALTGTSFETLVRDVERLQLNLGKAGTATGPVAQGLQALGLRATELKGLSIPEQMDKIAEATARFADGGSKTAAIMAVLGRNGAEMIPFLDKGAEGMKELGQAAQATGGVMSTEMAEASEKTKEHITEMQLAWQGLSNRLYEVVSPATDFVVIKIKEMLESIKPETIKSYALQIESGLTEIIIHIGDAVIDLSGLIQTVLGDLGKLGEKAQLIGFGAAVGGVAGGAAAGVGALPGAIIGGSVGGLAATLKQWAEGTGDQKPIDTAAIKAAFDAKVRAASGQIHDAMAAVDVGTYGSIPDHVGGFMRGGGRADVFDLLLGGMSPKDMPKPQVGDMQIGGNSGAAAARKAAQEQLAATLEAARGDMKAATDTANEKIKLYDHELKMHQISDDDKLQLTIAALNEEYAAQLATLQKELALDNLKPQQRNKILNEIADLERKHAAEIQDLQFKAAEATAAKWTGYFSTIQGEFNGHLKQLLSGSENWGQAMKQILGDVIIKFIEACEKMAFQWAAKELANAAATAASQATATAAVAAGAAAQHAINATSVAGDAARAAAGAYAAVAGVPIIGPILAPIAAGVAFAGVEAFGSFAQGAMSVPYTMPAFVHAGEVILPTGGPAETFRSAMMGAAGGQGGGGGNHTHHHTWNVTVVKPVNGDEVIRSLNGRVAEVGRTLGQHFGNNSRIGGAR